MLKQKDYPFILSDIKQKLEGGKMSALVGAGFSKNFNDKIFPSWWQLLRDMVNESQGDNIKERFEAQVQIKGKILPTLEDFRNTNLDRYIDRVGPLKAVSEYIAKKGYREAADFKIEEATPVIDIEDGLR
ncbi:MAG: hypothetical protein EOO20_21930, partial [Chryseobacterium sp.]